MTKCPEFYIQSIADECQDKISHNDFGYVLQDLLSALNNNEEWDIIWELYNKLLSLSEWLAETEFQRQKFKQDICETVGIDVISRAPKDLNQDLTTT